MEITNEDWWTFGIAFILTMVFAWNMIRSAERQQLSNMRGDGLTEKDIQDILGKDGYHKLIRSQ